MHSPVCKLLYASIEGCTDPTSPEFLVCHSNLPDLVHGVRLNPDPLFLQHFRTRPHEKKEWFSRISESNKWLKTSFFKVAKKEANRRYFFHSDDRS